MLDPRFLPHIVDIVDDDPESIINVDDDTDDIDSDLDLDDDIDPEEKGLAEDLSEDFDAYE